MAYVKPATPAAWTALEKSTTESTVGLIVSTHEAVRNGVNVFVRIPRVGDIVLHDSNNKVHFISLDSYQSLPDGFTTIGVVGAVRGRKVLIVYKDNQAKKWADVYRYIVTGWTADGADHSCAVTLHDTADGTFTYNLSSSLSAAEQVTEFASQLSAWILSHELASYHYSAYEEDGKVYLQLDNYTAYQNTTTITGLTLTAAIGTELTANSSIPRVEGAMSSAYVNKGRYNAYISTNGATPTAAVTVADSTVTKAAFKTSAYCAALRTQFCSDTSNPTDAEYNDYTDYRVDHYLGLINPSMKGIMAPAFRDGHANTYALVGKTYLAQDSTRKPLYLAAEYCASIGFAGVKGLEAGDWYLPTVEEIATLMEPVTYSAPQSTRSAADALNRGLNAIGGTAVSNGSNFWTSCRYDTDYAWFFSGGGGHVVNVSFYHGYQALPVALFELGTSEE